MSTNTVDKPFPTQVKEIQEGILQRAVSEMLELGHIKSSNDVIAKFETLENNIFTNNVARLYKFYFFGDFPLRLYISDGEWESVSLSRTSIELGYSLSFKPVWHERVFK